jgi:hypothetical protein
MLTYFSVGKPSLGHNFHFFAVVEVNGQDTVTWYQPVTVANGYGPIEQVDGVPTEAIKLLPQINLQAINSFLERFMQQASTVLTGGLGTADSSPFGLYIADNEEGRLEFIGSMTLSHLYWVLTGTTQNPTKIMVTDKAGRMSNFNSIDEARDWCRKIFERWLDNPQEGLNYDERSSTVVSNNRNG